MPRYNKSGRIPNAGGKKRHNFIEEQKKRKKHEKLRKKGRIK